jgi:hypothetical protein
MSCFLGRSSEGRPPHRIEADGEPTPETCIFLRRYSPYRDILSIQRNSTTRHMVARGQADFSSRGSVRRRASGAVRRERQRDRGRRVASRCRFLSRAGGCPWNLGVKQRREAVTREIFEPRIDEHLIASDPIGQRPRPAGARGNDCRPADLALLASARTPRSPTSTPTHRKSRHVYAVGDRPRLCDVFGRAIGRLAAFVRPLTRTTSHCRTKGGSARRQSTRVISSRQQPRSRPRRRDECSVRVPGGCGALQDWLRERRPQC